ncbi:aromatic ring-hydroxylating oxygenase subunit alpha [Paracoccus pantotrophus]|uniref:aromatic ring-hydroxylating oxygenase subunit alpha n=1 Tax=Paracoccus pantotrophus TaxID=82367 RepID=UPI0004B2BBC7|nr:aromatic ring-hydroxylating dioxygenase subunit alpha [Paracoccus pantotrophus]
MPAAFYLSPEIYDLDINGVLMKHWQCVTHVSAIPEVGDYVVFNYDRESAIIVRDKDGEIRGFANVCRHRGSRICESSGKAEGGMLICPYHAWAYSTDGSLAHARMMPRTLDKSTLGLKPLAVKVVQGLIFLSFADEPLSFDDCEANLNATLGAYDWAGAKIAFQSTISFSANWKLALENQVECYHCGPSHPEFSVVHGQSSGSEKKLAQMMNAKAEALGVDITITDQWAEKARPGYELSFSDRFPMSGENVCTASRDGAPLAPRMGKFAAGYDNGQTVAYVGVMNHFLCYGDYGAAFRYTPKSVNETELAVMWLVRGDAVEGKDYDLDELTWMWKVTAGADKRIVQENQIGVSSRFYTPGPYALPIEQKTARLSDWYLSALSKAISA